MATSTRITATNILFNIGMVDYSCDANAIALELGDASGDVQTFCEQRVGGQWTLKLDGITSGDSASLYQLLWTNFGSTAAFTIAPKGNATPGVGAPTYTGTVLFNQLPPLALNSGDVATFSVTLKVDNTGHTPLTGLVYGVQRNED